MRRVGSLVWESIASERRGRSFFLGVLAYLPCSSAKFRVVERLRVVYGMLHKGTTRKTNYSIPTRIDELGHKLETETQNVGYSFARA